MPGADVSLPPMTSNHKSLLLAGGTGLVGGLFLDASISSGWHVCTIGRRATGRVEQELICDFSELPALPAIDVAVCALGTTIAAAGSKSAFRAVDYAAVIALAEAVKQQGVEHFILVSSIGAHPRAASFYARVKGEVERDLEALKFKRLDIAQPGLLLGDRAQRRPVEAFLQRLAPVAAPLMRGSLRQYAAIEAWVVAQALLRLADKQQAGVYRHDNAALLSLAESG